MLSLLCISGNSPCTLKTLHSPYIVGNIFGASALLELHVCGCLWRYVLNPTELLPLSQIIRCFGFSRYIAYRTVSALVEHWNSWINFGRAMSEPLNFCQGIWPFALWVAAHSDFPPSVGPWGTCGQLLHHNGTSLGFTSKNYAMGIIISIIMSMTEFQKACNDVCQ